MILVIGLGQMVKVKTLRMRSADVCQIKEHKKGTSGRRIAKMHRMEPVEEIVKKTRAVGAIHWMILISGDQQRACVDAKKKMRLNLSSVATVEVTIRDFVGLIATIVAGPGHPLSHGTLIEQHAGAMLEPLERSFGELINAITQTLAAEDIAKSADGVGRLQMRIGGVVRLLLVAVAYGSEK